jgi:DNA-binding MltR family transcriptional regulator
MISLKDADEEIAFYYHDSNRAVGVMWPAIVENRLIALLRATFIKDEKRAESMLSPSGPLGNFGAKINLAYLLGLYGKEVHQDLVTVSKIRNKFAHDITVKEFETDPIKSYIQNLDMYRVGRELLAHLESTAPTSPDPQQRTMLFVMRQEMSDMRSVFHYAIRMYIHLLVSLENRVLEADRAYFSWSDVVP